MFSFYMFTKGHLKQGKTHVKCLDDIAFFCQWMVSKLQKYNLMPFIFEKVALPRGPRARPPLGPVFGIQHEIDTLFRNLTPKELKTLVL